MPLRCLFLADMTLFFRCGHEWPKEGGPSESKLVITTLRTLKIAILA